MLTSPSLPVVLESSSMKGIESILPEKRERKIAIYSYCAGASQSGWIPTSVPPDRKDNKDLKEEDESKSLNLPHDLTILSWNVWFGEYYMRDRMLAIGKIIAKYNPDVIALQEVTPLICSYLLRQPWAQKYFVSDPEGRELRTIGYGVMVLTRTRPISLSVCDFPSKLNRRAVWATLRIPGVASPLIFGTFHLESFPEDSPKRKLQMEMYSRICEANKSTHVLLCGDSNFAAENESSVFTESAVYPLQDAWATLYQQTPEDAVRNPGVTFDTENNSMATAGKTVQSMHTSMTRLDRLFYTSNSIKPTHMEIIGTEPIDRAKYLWPSDHYGIMIKVNIRQDFELAITGSIPSTSFSTSSSSSSSSSSTISSSLVGGEHANSIFSTTTATSSSSSLNGNSKKT